MTSTSVHYRPSPATNVPFADCTTRKESYSTHVSLRHTPVTSTSQDVIQGGTRHLARAYCAAQATPHGPQNNTTSRLAQATASTRNIIFNNAKQNNALASNAPHATPHQHATTPSSRVSAPTPAEQTYIRDKTQIAYRSRLDRAAVVLVTRLRTTWNGDQPPKDRRAPHSTGTRRRTLGDGAHHRHKRSQCTRITKHAQYTQSKVGGAARTATFRPETTTITSWSDIVAS